MAKFVPYLADEMIEGDAALLLADYAHARAASSSRRRSPSKTSSRSTSSSASSSTTPPSCSACRVRASIPTSLLQFSSTITGGGAFIPRGEAVRISPTRSANLNVTGKPLE
jgi:hypothetical protein